MPLTLWHPTRAHCNQSHSRFEKKQGTHTARGRVFFGPRPCAVFVLLLFFLNVNDFGYCCALSCNAPRPRYHCAVIYSNDISGQIGFPIQPLDFTHNHKSQYPLLASRHCAPPKADSSRPDVVSESVDDEAGGLFCPWQRTAIHALCTEGATDPRSMSRSGRHGRPIR